MKGAHDMTNGMSRHEDGNQIKQRSTNKLFRPNTLKTHTKVRFHILNH